MIILDLKKMEWVMAGQFKPQKMERIGIGLMEDMYSFHRSLWTWKMDDKGYLIVTKKAIKPRGDRHGERTI